MQLGDLVVIRTPENPRLDGARAVVTVLADWGAHVSTEASATGKFRALWSEMELVTPPKVVTPNYTGDVCNSCGGVNMVRSGACLTCQNCGTSNGCS